MGSVVNSSSMRFSNALTRRVELGLADVATIDSVVQQPDESRVGPRPQDHFASGLSAFEEPMRLRSLRKRQEGAHLERQFSGHDEADDLAQCGLNQVRERQVRADTEARHGAVRNHQLPGVDQRRLAARTGVPTSRVVTPFPTAATVPQPLRQE